ncbi:hypothetical protein SEVIR_4G229450v4 [Setaria viridis]
MVAISNIPNPHIQMIFLDGVCLLVFSFLSELAIDFAESNCSCQLCLATTALDQVHCKHHHSQCKNVYVDGRIVLQKVSYHELNHSLCYTRTLLGSAKKPIWKDKHVSCISDMFPSIGSSVLFGRQFVGGNYSSCSELFQSIGKVLATVYW